MSQKREDLTSTTMRVTKRTARYVEYLKGFLKLRTGKDYSPDDIVWEAINVAFKDEIDRVNETIASLDDKPNP